MSVRQPWVILGLRFKKDWEAELKRILRDSPHGQRLLDAHHGYVMAALSCHPEAEAKIGPGIDHFETGRSPAFGSTCFHAIRTDGTRVTFSHRACLDGKPSAWAAFSAALRGAISVEILNWKNEQFAGGPIPCPLCGGITARQGSHVDHRHPQTFGALARGFCQAFGVDPFDVAYQDSPLWVLESKDLGDCWVRFHREYADLRILCAQCNVRIGDRSAA